MRLLRPLKIRGTKIAKSKGVKFGSPKIEITSEILEIFKKYKNKKCSYKEALKSSSLSHGTFYNYYRIFFKNNS